MLEKLIPLFLGLALFAIGFRCFLAIFISKLRVNWRGTNVKTGAISNIGFSIMFLYGSILTLFFSTPTQSFWWALSFVVLPLSLAVWLGFQGYRLDLIKNQEGGANESNT